MVLQKQLVAQLVKKLLSLYGNLWFVTVFTRDHLPNVVVEWLTLLLRIREVLCSDLGSETGHPD
jgi:hypothetical protein